ncbi:MAG: YraN family protein [Terriglobales bacterium]
MSGNLTRLALRAMDQAAKLVRQPPEQPPHLLTGRRGEEEAYFYLRRMGYVIVARNYRSRRHPSEIDLVGWDGEVLCFIEVKTRTSREVKPAEAAVDVEKQGDLRGMAREYLRHHPSKPKTGSLGTPARVAGSPAHRFDILSIYILDGAHLEFTLFKNAFPVS